MTHPLTYRARNGALMALSGFDEFGDPEYRPASVEEEHRDWASQRNSFDALAQRADDDWTERNWA